jgi:hypothetical protein
MRDTHTVIRTMTRLLHAVAAVAVLGILFAGQPAVAQEDDEPARDEGVIGNLMRGLGAGDSSSGINYRERSPLVVPRKLDLPPPEQRRPETANWPKDPDVLEKRAAREAAKKRDRAQEADMRQMTRIQPEPDLGAARARTATVSPQPGLSDQSRGINENNILLSPSQLGVTSSLSKLFGTKRDDENVPFTAEPPRESLTQPPPGYQTPSTGYAYGITNAERARTLQQQQNQNEPRAVMAPGSY